MSIIRIPLTVMISLSLFARERVYFVWMMNNYVTCAPVKSIHFKFNQTRDIAGFKLSTMSFGGVP